MNPVIECRYCGNLAATCVCDVGANDVASYSSTGLPLDRDGNILTHLCTAEQRRAINEALVPRVDFSRRQFG